VKFAANRPTAVRISATADIGFPILILIGFWAYFMRQMQAVGGRGAMSFGQEARARLLVRSVKHYLSMCRVERPSKSVEIVDFLKDPGKFQNLAASYRKRADGRCRHRQDPAARAIAGEAKVPFFTISGSDFRRDVVGFGASRVRDIVRTGKSTTPASFSSMKSTPSPASRRRAWAAARRARANLEQLWSKMDGFEAMKAHVIAATNGRCARSRRCCARPFRSPSGRAAADVAAADSSQSSHAQVPLGDNVSLRVCARHAGFSVRILPIRQRTACPRRAQQAFVTMERVRARQRQIMMARAPLLVMTEEENTQHRLSESGHAIVFELPEHDPVYKVTSSRAPRAGLTISCGIGFAIAPAAPARAAQRDVVRRTHRRRAVFAPSVDHGCVQRHRTRHGAGGTWSRVGPVGCLRPQTYSEEPANILGPASRRQAGVGRDAHVITKKWSRHDNNYSAPTNSADQHGQAADHVGGLDQVETIDEEMIKTSWKAERRGRPRLGRHDTTRRRAARRQRAGARWSSRRSALDLETELTGGAALGHEQLRGHKGSSASKLAHTAKQIGNRPKSRRTYAETDAEKCSFTITDDSALRR